MKILLGVVGAALFSLTAVTAQATPLFNGEQFGITGTWTVTAGTHLGQTGTIIGSFTIDALGHVTAFSGQSADCVSNCSNPWTFNLTFDGSTLSGTASVPFTGGGGDSREWDQTFLAG